MNTDLHKRLEESAEKYADKHGFRIPYDGSNNFYDETDVKASKDGFLTGAEYGYKEAIAEITEWMYDNARNYVDGVFWYDRMMRDLKTFMNKLREGEK